MKFFVAFCLLFAMASAEYALRNRENMLAYRQECIKELNIPAKLVEQYQKWQYPNDPKTQCYMKCVFTKFGFFDAHTGYNVENVLTQLNRGSSHHDDKLHHKISACVDKNEQGSDACEWAWRGATCVLKNHLQLVQQSLA